MAAVLDRAAFYTAVRLAPVPGHLTPARVSGMDAILDACPPDTPADHLAYGLGACPVGTAWSMLPIREKGRSRRPHPDVRHPRRAPDEGTRARQPEPGRRRAVLRTRVRPAHRAQQRSARHLPPALARLPAPGPGSLGNARRRAGVRHRGGHPVRGPTRGLVHRQAAVRPRRPRPGRLGRRAPHHQRPGPGGRDRRACPRVPSRVDPGRAPTRVGRSGGTACDRMLDAFGCAGFHGGVDAARRDRGADRRQLDGGAGAAALISASAQEIRRCGFTSPRGTVGDGRHQYSPPPRPPPPRSLLLKLTGGARPNQRSDCVLRHENHQLSR